MRRSIDSAGTANRAAREERFFGITVGRFRQTHRECSIIRCGSSIARDRDTAVYCYSRAKCCDGKPWGSEIGRNEAAGRSRERSIEGTGGRKTPEVRIRLESTLGLLPWPDSCPPRQQAIG